MKTIDNKKKRSLVFYVDITSSTNRENWRLVSAT